MIYNITISFQPSIFNFHGSTKFNIKSTTNFMMSNFLQDYLTNSSGLSNILPTTSHLFATTSSSQRYCNPISFLLSLQKDACVSLYLTSSSFSVPFISLMYRMISPSKIFLPALSCKQVYWQTVSGFTSFISGIPFTVPQHIYAFSHMQNKYPCIYSPLSMRFPLNNISLIPVSFLIFNLHHSNLMLVRRINNMANLCFYLSLLLDISPI